MKNKSICFPVAIVIALLAAQQSFSATIQLLGADGYMHSIVSDAYCNPYCDQHNQIYISKNINSTNYPARVRAFLEFNLQPLYENGIDAASITAVNLDLVGTSFRQGDWDRFHLYAMTGGEDGVYSTEFNDLGTQLFSSQFETVFDITSYFVNDVAAGQTHSGYALNLQNENGVGLDNITWFNNPIITITYVETGPGPDDSDNDGITDDLDYCPDTPEGAIVDTAGCPIDCLSQEDVDQAVADALYEKDSLIVDLKLTIADLEVALAQKYQIIQELNTEVSLLTVNLNDKTATIGSLNGAIADLQSLLTFRDQTIADLTSQIEALQNKISEKDQEIELLHELEAEKDQRIADLTVQMSTMYTQEQLDQALADSIGTAVMEFIRGLHISGGIPGATPTDKLQNLKAAINASPACRNNIEKFFRKKRR